jgi:hypothetical protein
LDDNTRAELTRLRHAISPPQEALDAISQSETAYSPARLASANPINLQQSSQCKSLAGLGYDPDDIGDNVVCYLYTEENVSGNTFRIYYPVEWKGDEDFTELINHTMTALKDGYTTFSQYDTLQVKNINLIFSIFDSGTTNGQQDYFDIDNQACPITMFPKANEDYFLEQYKQIVAHEMFHCVQDWSFPQTSPYKAHSWWLEGTADYFSNLVYPSANEEWNALLSFDRTSRNTPLDGMTYENFIFFQFMANQYSTANLISILSSISSSGGSQSALSGVENISENFNRFVVKYLSTGIQDTSGAMILLEHPAATDSKEITDEGEETVSADPFVATRYAVSYKEEMRFLQEPTTIITDGNFSAVEADFRRDIFRWSDLPPEVRSECEDDILYVFVVTSTESSKFDYNFRVSEAERAVCDPCLLGAWAIDNDSFEDFILRLSENQDMPADAGDFTIEIEGFNYIEFNEDARFITRRDAYAITIGASNYDATFTTVIDSQGGGVYSADGENLQVSQITDYVNSIDAFMAGVPISLSQTPGSGTYNFFGNTTSGPGLTQQEGPQKASGTYVCEEDILVIDQPVYGEVLFNRVEKILPTPIPTPSAP